MRLNHEMSVFENRRNCIAHRASSISMAGYVDAVPAFVCFELPAREASSFCDFWKLTSCNFIAFISSLIEVNFFLYFLDMLIKDKFT